MDSPVRSSRSSSGESKTSATYSSSSPNALSQKRWSDDSSSLDHQPRHKHNDYSCYIHLINKTGLELELVDSHAKSGRWAIGSPAPLIEPDTETLIELNDPKGPHGSEGSCIYRLHHPQKSNAVTFKLKFGDPYWRGDDNFLRATTQYTKCISSNVRQHPKRGHPFIAYVEIDILEVKGLDRRISQRTTATTRTTRSEATSRSEDSEPFHTDAPVATLPSFSNPLKDQLGLNKEPVLVVQPVDAGDDSDNLTHGRDDDAIVSIHNSDDNEEQKNVQAEHLERDPSLTQDADSPEQNLDVKVEIPEDIPEQKPEEELDARPEETTDKDHWDSLRKMPEEVPEAMADEELSKIAPDHLEPKTEDSPEERPAESAELAEEQPAAIPVNDLKERGKIENQTEDNLEEKPTESAEEQPEVIPVDDLKEREKIDNRREENPAQLDDVVEPQLKPELDAQNDHECEPKLDSKAPKIIGNDVEVEVEPVPGPESKSQPKQEPTTDTTQHEAIPAKNVPTIISEPALSSEPSHWTTIIKPHHARLGIVATVFLASYGYTAARVSGGLFFGLGRIRR